jgi:hypothetical protein
LEGYNPDLYEKENSLLQRREEIVPIQAFVLGVASWLKFE